MKTLTKLFFFISYFLFSFSPFLFSQTTIIKGNIENFKNNQISLYSIDDFFTLNETLLNSSEIDENGKFEIKINLTKTIKAILKTENSTSSLFLEPNKNYQIVFPEIATSNPTSISVLENITLKFQTIDSTELNYLISDLNVQYENFLQKNQTNILKNSLGNKVNLFEEKMNARYSKINNFYFKKFVFYSIASLYQLAYTNKKKMFSEYIFRKPILYDNPEYINFFKDFYSNYLYSYSQTATGNGILEDINSNKDLDTIMNKIRKDILLENDSIRELVLIYGLFVSNFKNGFDKKNILSLLKSISGKTKIEEHKKITRNIIYQISHLNIGELAPDFKLMDVNNKLFKLDDFSGKYVYLHFWTTWSVPSLQEMKNINTLHEKYGKKINFVSISVDKEKSAFINFLAKNNYEWTFLHYGNQKKIVEDYDIKSLPTYFLISPDGKFFQSPALSPNGNIEQTFFDLTNKPKKKYKVGDK